MEWMLDDVGKLWTTRRFSKAMKQAAPATAALGGVGNGVCLARNEMIEGRIERDEAPFIGGHRPQHVLPVHVPAEGHAVTRQTRLEEQLLAERKNRVRLAARRKMIRAVRAAGRPTWADDRGSARGPAMGTAGACPGASAGGGPGVATWSTACAATDANTCASRERATSEMGRIRFASASLGCQSAPRHDEL